MTKAKKRKCVVGYAVVALLALGFSLFFVATSYADCNLNKNGSKLDEFAQNNILFYCPGASNNSLCAGASYGSEITWDDLDRCGETDIDCRMKKLLEAYAPFAMNLQRWYGVPWELPFAVMITESGAGTEATPDYPNQKAKSKGYYNMMGLTWDNWFGEVEHYEKEHEPFEICLGGDQKCQGNNFSYYDSISKMMLGFVVYHLRAGPEKNPAAIEGLKQLNPDSSYEGALRDSIDKMLQSYCYIETTDGKKSACYTDEVMDIIRGDGGKYHNTTIQDMIKAYGWKNSTELAISENLPAGGYVSTDEFVSENGWGGWTDIREGAWDAYGALGLPADVADGIGGFNSGCGTRLQGSCFKLESEYDGGCTDDNFTFFFQGKGTTWANEPYAECLVRDAACGPTSIAMIATAMNNTLITPLDVVTKVKERDGPNPENWKIQIRGCGGSSSYVLGVVEEYGLHYETLNPLGSNFNVETINSYLDNGDMVLVGVGGEVLDFYDKDNNFGQEALSAPDLGHYVVIRARTDDGYWSLFDGGQWYGVYRNFRKYDPETVVNAVKVHNGNGRGGAWRVFK